MLLQNPGAAWESVRLHTLTIFWTPAVPPIEPYVRSAASLSLSRIMISRSLSFAWVGESLLRRYSAAIHALISDAVVDVASILDDPKISPVRRSSTAQLRKPVVCTESRVMFAGRSGSGGWLGPAVGACFENGPPGTKRSPAPTATRPSTTMTRAQAGRRDLRRPWLRIGRPRPPITPMPRGGGGSTGAAAAHAPARSEPAGRARAGPARAVAPVAVAGSGPGRRTRAPGWPGGVAAVPRAGRGSDPGPAAGRARWRAWPVARGLR